MKKISILSLHLGYGGIERAVVSLANLLCKKYEVEIAVIYNIFDNNIYKFNKNVKIIYLNDTSIKPNHESLKKAFKSFNIFKIISESIYTCKILFYRKKSMKNYIKNCNSDIIISTRDIFNTWVGKYSKSNNLKIAWEHNHYHGNFKYAKKIVKSVNKFDYLVLVSRELRDFYSKKINNKCRCIYIPNYIDSLPDKVSSLLNKNIISVGRLSIEKGFLDLLKVFSIIHKKYPDWILNIVGDGLERDNLEKYIDENNLSNFVILHGFQNKDYIEKLMNNSSIYLMTSFTESFGIVLIEAMSHGLVCIAMDSAEGAREIIEDGYNGFLVHNRNYDEMVDVFSKLIYDKKLLVETSKNSRSDVLKYTSDVVGKSWFELIEGVDSHE